MIRIIEENQWQMLQRVKDGLHGKGETLTPEARRDLANLMSLVLSQIEWAGDFEEQLNKKGER